MGISDYLKGLRARVGHDLVMVPAVAAAVRDADGRVLLQLRADDGLWGLPGGAIDPGEAPARAVVRETFEETGLDVVPRRVLGVFGGRERFRHVYPNGDVSENVVILFACRVMGGTLGSRDGESLELRFVALDDLPSSPILERYDLPRLLAGADAAPYFAWDDAWRPGRAR